MKKNWYIYFFTIVIIFAVKLFYRTADSDMLLWILAPTTGWVRILSGIPFEYIAKAGYVSHEYRFIIAPSCSGVRFLLLVFAMLVFSFTARIDSAKKKVCWYGFSAVFSYLSTIFVNGIRITVSIYLPPVLMDQKLMPGWLTAERLHTMIGTAVYFCMLFAIYHMAGLMHKHLFKNIEVEQKPASKLSAISISFIGPVFWYLVMVLGIPFAGRLYRNDWEGFWPYALLVAGVCVPVIFVFFISYKVRNLKSLFSLRLQKRIFR